MGNKLRLKLNSSTGRTRGLLRFASDKATIVIDTLKSEKTMIQAELTKTRTSIASLESKLTDFEKKYHKEAKNDVAC